jgi:hypothetical protein
MRHRRARRPGATETRLARVGKMTLTPGFRIFIKLNQERASWHVVAVAGPRRALPPQSPESARGSERSPGIQCRGSFFRVRLRTLEAGPGRHPLLAGPSRVCGRNAERRAGCEFVGIAHWRRC